MSNTLENIRVLEGDIAYLERKLDGLLEYHPDGCLEAESVDRILNVKYRLLSEQQERLDREQSEAARLAAEARLQHHLDNDTLDLY